jgi:hemerythrin
MEFFPWKEKYNVGIKEIDDQHKKLVKLLSDLFQSMETNQGKDALAPILAGLVEYTKTHFATEERLMKSYGYPDYEPHKKKHEEFTRKVLDFQKQFQSGNFGLSVQVGYFLKDWLKKHIQGTDKKYIPFLSSKGVK